MENIIMSMIQNDENGSTQIEAEVEAEIQQVIPAAFCVQCSETAAWVVRRIVAARQYAEHVKEWADRERRRASHEEQRLLSLFEGQLRDWAEAEIIRTKSRRKSIALPGGTLGFRSVPVRIVVQDEPALLAWARTSCPTAVVVSERLLKTPVHEHFERTGEVPLGVIVVPAETAFYIR